MSEPYIETQISLEMEAYIEDRDFREVCQTGSRYSMHFPRLVAPVR